MKVGFDVSDQESEQPEEQGYAEPQLASAEEHSMIWGISSSGTSWGSV